jgi:hypothetical protein
MKEQEWTVRNFVLQRPRSRDTFTYFIKVFERGTKLEASLVFGIDNKPQIGIRKTYWLYFLAERSKPVCWSWKMTKTAQRTKSHRETRLP